MKKFRLLLAAGLLLLLTGCFSQSVEELYAPPRAPDDYLKLDNKINEVLNEGGEYAAPLTGEYTQKVQLQDLDGDGVQEAIAFFRVSSSERPLKIYVYRQTGDNYEVAAIIEGEGSAINYVAYENLDNSPSKEIIVSWQMMSDQNHSLAAYSINNDHVLELMRTSYTNFQICDIDQDSQGEIVVVQTGVTEESNRVELYNYQDGMMELNSSAPLSRNVTGLPDGGVKTGYLQDNIPAVFVSSTYGRSGTAQNYTDISYSESGQITDILPGRMGESRISRWTPILAKATIPSGGIPRSPPRISTTTAFWSCRTPTRCRTLTAPAWRSISGPSVGGSTILTASPIWYSPHITMTGMAGTLSCRTTGTVRSPSPAVMWPVEGSGRSFSPTGRGAPTWTLRPSWLSIPSAGTTGSCGPICRAASGCWRETMTAIPSMPPVLSRQIGTADWMRAASRRILL